MRFLTIVWMALLSASGFGQVRPVYSSVESYVADSKLVCVGKIATIANVKVGTYDAIELTIDVSETLKGRAQKTIKAHRYDQEANATYQAIQKVGADSVWFVPHGEAMAGFPKDDARNDLCLEQSLSNYRAIGGLAIGMDFTIPRTRKEVIDRIRKFIKENPAARSGESLLTPLPGQSLTAWVDFIIPLCPWAEKLAVRMITKPESFTFGPPTGNPYDPAAEPLWPKSKEGMLRTEGLILLRHYPSAANIQLVKRYLNDDSIAMKQPYGQPITTYYWVRDAAFRLLCRWKVEVDQPQIDGPPMEYRQGLFVGDGRRISYAFQR